MVKVEKLLYLEVCFQYTVYIVQSLKIQNSAFKIKDFSHALK